MRFLSTRLHGTLDYLMSIVLIVTPLWLRLQVGPDSGILILVGVVTLVYSLATQYGVGLIGVLPVRMHLVLDGIFGLLLLCSPWIFNFAYRVWLPHVVLGALMLVSALMTRTATHRTPLRNFGSW